jgi:RimJ/RimL family protein N-acetyltransferase
MHAPPERIELPTVGAALRRKAPGDLDALHAAIAASRDHLRPFMPFADQAVEATAAHLARTAQGWVAGTEHDYVVVDAASGRVLGCCGIHRRIGPAAEIGYWLRADATGRGIVTVAAGALTEVALMLDGVHRVEIHCDEANTASAAVPVRLGFALDRVEPAELKAPGDTGRMMIWVLSPGGTPATPGGPR